LELEDAETGQRLLLDTRNRAARDAFRSEAAARLQALKQLAAQARTDLVEVSTDGTHLDALIRFFRLRERRLRRS
jgi:hypothetical protein